MSPLAIIIRQDSEAKIEGGMLKVMGK